ncbi:Glucose--fructose oxidoreductase precursor [Symmachiella dynata]|uniref:Glucose--fructose oxidoreductase n=1 Tax=Symmachiella dynata TaxID=2527995 RepID=A0A517ZNG7_9PLAN|nr:Gfo/Idh/MocA family oxidoreductase [Symmachiella dynata]QDU44001.1 Glucose--fructose oxidoreductase precursor [Symmachiella dynata]
MTVGWGIVGCSDIVRRRAADAILAQPDSHIAAFFSHSSALADEHAARYGGRGYTNLDALLADEDVSIVYVASPVERHAPETIAAANAGKHVLVEKPMALTAAQCDAMIAAAQANSVHCAVAYYARWLPKVREMKRLLDEQALGTVVRAHVAQLSEFNPAADDPKIWRVRGRAGGGALADVGSHRLDLLHYLLGPPVAVWAACDKTTHPDWQSPDTETVFVRYASGTHLTLVCNWNTPHGVPAWELHGTQGSIVSDPWNAEPLTILGRDDFPVFESTYPDNAHFGVVHDFARADIENRPPEFPAEQGAWATRIIEAAQTASQTGRVVEFA